MREIYNFICNNYADGDAIVLVGFSRGAFTARAVADMIATLGLLNVSGLDHFFAIFKDYEHLESDKRPNDEFLYKDLTPFRGETGKARWRVEERRKQEYRRWLRDTVSLATENRIRVYVCL